MSGKGKSAGKNKKKGPRVVAKRELIEKEDGQDYAQVTKMLGNRRLKALCFDGVERQCLIRGKLVKKVWICMNDIILVGLRDYQDDKADVIHKYTVEEARQLKKLGVIPDSIRINEMDAAFDMADQMNLGAEDGESDEESELESGEEKDDTVDIDAI